MPLSSSGLTGCITMIYHRRRLGLLFLVFVFSGACSSVPVERPVAELALASSALDIALNSGADEYAPIELRIARFKLKAANQALASRDFEKARLLFAEARVDAELAKAVSEKEKARIELAEALDGIQVIHHQVSENAEQ